MDVDAVNENGMDGVNAAEVIYNLGADEVELEEGDQLSIKEATGIAAHTVRMSSCRGGLYRKRLSGIQKAASKPCVQALGELGKTGRSCVFSAELMQRCPMAALRIAS